jgi:hypothetical protein
MSIMLGRSIFIGKVGNMWFRVSRTCLAASAAALSLGACVPAGPSLHTTTYGYVQTVSSGSLSRMGDYNTVSGDGRRSCHLQPLPSIHIVAKPAHGELLVTSGERSFEAGTSTPLGYCNGRRFAAKIVQYRSTPHYVGPDHLSYQVVFADGTAETYEKDLTVR